MKTIITIPCYNETNRLPVSKFRKFLQAGNNISFIFVNDGSKDNTLSVIEHLADSCGNKVKVLDFMHNKGKAEAVRQGIKSSFSNEPDIVGFWDADLATPLSAIFDFLKVYEKLPKIKWIFGARVKLLGRKIIRNEIRHYTGRVFATATSIILNLPIYDSQCGAKLFKNDNLLQEIFHEPFKSKWIFDVELIARLKKLSLDQELARKIIYEYPLYEWTDISGSKLKITDFFSAPKDLLNIWLYLNR